MPCDRNAESNRRGRVEGVGPVLEFEAYNNSAELEDGKGRAYLMMAYCALEIGDKEEAVAQLELDSNYPEQASKAREILSKIDVYLP